jgi:transcriptional regulator PpsR
LSRSDGRRDPGKGAQPRLAPDIEIVEATSDIALTLEADGTIVKVSGGGEDWPVQLAQHWSGQHWSRVVSSDSRPKVEEMLLEAASGKRSSRWRHINHVDPTGVEIPVLVSLIRIGEDGQLVAVGRDLRVVSSLQARLIESQQRMEADYLRLRRAESQYRQLLDVVRDPILIIQQPGHAILEANRAACAFFGLDRDTLLGRTLDGFLSTRSAAALRIMFEQVTGSGRPAEMSMRFNAGAKSTQLFASSMRQEGDTVVLLRIEAEAGESPALSESTSILEAVRQLSDGIVTTDAKGLILSANPAFVEMIQVAHAGQLIGEPLSRWLGRAHTDLTVLINSLAQGGSIRLFSTRLVGASGIPVPVEISGVAVANEDAPYLAFVIRDTGRRLGDDREPSAVGRSGGDLAALVGRMPLKDIVGETVDLIERLCIEAALRITRNNRASAADMLGLSRQSLYVKLRRYGIEGPELGDSGP